MFWKLYLFTRHKNVLNYFYVLFCAEKAVDVFSSLVAVIANY